MKKIYKADNGKEFENKEDCINYEKAVKETEDVYEEFNYQLGRLEAWGGFSGYDPDPLEAIFDISFYSIDYDKYIKMLRECVDAYEEYMLCKVKNKEIEESKDNG